MKQINNLHHIIKIKTLVEFLRSILEGVGVVIKRKKATNFLTKAKDTYNDCPTTK